MSWRKFDEIAEDYDSWYDRHQEVFLEELTCLKSFSWKEPSLGVGTGRFSSALGIWLGLDPAHIPLLMAHSRGTQGVQGFAENLPFREGSLGSVFFITTLCFVDPERALLEASRVLKYRGSVISCIIPRDSPLGREYSSRGEGSIFSYAKFLSLDELIEIGRLSGLYLTEVCYTLFIEHKPSFVCAKLEKR